MTMDSSPKNSADAKAAKPAWATPSIEEVDLASTQASAAYGGVDGGIYHS
jgi:hypothetical protein